MTAEQQRRENKYVNTALAPLPYPEIEGMQLNADVVLGDLILNTIDSDNTVWVCSDIDGWWTLPPPEIRDIPRGHGDGSYDVLGRWLPRQIELSGTFLPQSPEMLPIARQKLIDAINLVVTGDWLRVYEDPPKACYVRLSGAPKISTVSTRGKTEWSVGLRAADPVKYEWADNDPEGLTLVEIAAKNNALGVDGTGSALNVGNALVPVTFEIQGPVTSPAAITNLTTGEEILLIAAVSGGSFLEIDTRQQEVSYNGDQTGARARIDTLADWIRLGAGINDFKFEDFGNPNSTAQLRIYYRSGWIGS